MSLTQLAGEDAVRLLAYFALAGGAGLSVEAAAKIADMPPLVVARLAERMGAAGVLEVHHDRRLSVEPVRLRQTLVRDVFCRGAAPLDWRVPLEAMPDRADTVAVLLAAALLGGSVDGGALQEQIASLRQTHRFGELCADYAWLGRDQSHWVLTEFPDLASRAAGALLAHLPAETIPILLRAGLAHEKYVRQDSDRLPQLKAWIDARGHAVHSVRRRIQLLDALESVGQELYNTPTLLTAVRHILAIHFDWTDQPPGEAAMLRLQQGFVPPAALNLIAALWPRVLRLLSNLSTANALTLPQLLADWANPRPFHSGQLSQAYGESCRQHARGMFADLGRAYADRACFKVSKAATLRGSGVRRFASAARRWIGLQETGSLHAHAIDRREWARAVSVAPRVLSSTPDQIPLIDAEENLRGSAWAPCEPFPKRREARHHATMDAR